MALLKNIQWRFQIAFCIWLAVYKAEYMYMLKRKKEAIYYR